MHITTAEKDAYLLSQKSMLRGQKKLPYIHTSREKKILLHERVTKNCVCTKSPTPPTKVKQSTPKQSELKAKTCNRHATFPALATGYYRALLYCSVSQGLGTTKFKNLIG